MSFDPSPWACDAEASATGPTDSTAEATSRPISPRSWVTAAARDSCSLPARLTLPGAGAATAWSAEAGSAMGAAAAETAAAGITTAAADAAGRTEAAGFESVGRADGRTGALRPGADKDGAGENMEDGTAMTGETGTTGVLTVAARIWAEAGAVGPTARMAATIDAAVFLMALSCAARVIIRRLAPFPRGPIGERGLGHGAPPPGDRRT